MVIDKPSGTLTLAGTIRTGHNWTYTAGTVDPGTSTVVFAGGTVTSAGMAFYDVVDNGGTTTLGSAMDVGRDLTVSAGHLHDVGRQPRPDRRPATSSMAGTLRLNGSAVPVARRHQA